MVFLKCLPYIWEMKKKETHESFAEIWIYLVSASHSCFLFFHLQLGPRYNLFVLLRKLTTFSFYNYNILVCCTEHTDVVQRVHPDMFAIYLMTHLKTSKWTPMYFPPRRNLSDERLKRLQESRASTSIQLLWPIKLVLTVCSGWVNWLISNNYSGSTSLRQGSRLYISPVKNFFKLPFETI